MKVKLVRMSRSNSSRIYDAEDETHEERFQRYRGSWRDPDWVFEGRRSRGNWHPAQVHRMLGTDPPGSAIGRRGNARLNARSVPSLIPVVQSNTVSVVPDYQDIEGYQDAVPMMIGASAAESVYVTDTGEDLMTGAIVHGDFRPVVDQNGYPIQRQFWPMSQKDVQNYRRTRAEMAAAPVLRRFVNRVRRMPRDEYLERLAARREASQRRVVGVRQRIRRMQLGFEDQNYAIREMNVARVRRGGGAGFFEPIPVRASVHN